MFTRVVFICVVYLNFFENTAVGSTIPVFAGNMRPSQMRTLYKGVPSYCLVQIFSNSLESGAFPDTTSTSNSPVSIVNLDTNISWIGESVIQSFRSFYSIDRHRSDCVVNLIYQLEKNNLHSSVKQKRLLTFVKNSVHFLRPAKSTIPPAQVFSFLRQTANHYNVAVFPMKISDWNLPTDTKLYDYHARHFRVLDYFAAVFIPENPTISTMKMCFLQQGKLPKLSNMNCEDLSESHLIRDFHVFTRLPDKWVATGSDVTYKDVTNNTVFPQNPFALKTTPTQLYVLGQLLKHTNSSLVNAYHSIPQTIKMEMDLVENFKKQPCMRITATNTDLMYFLTCHSKPILSFHLYVNPFDYEVWLGILLLAIVIGCLLSSLIRIDFQENSISFNVGLYLLSTLIDESFSVPDSLRNLQAFRWAIGLWTLMAVVLSNGYVSLVISELNSPMKSEKLEFYEDVACPWNSYNASKPVADFQTGVLSTVEHLRFYWLYKDMMNTTLDVKGLDPSRCSSLLSAPKKEAKLWNPNEGQKATRYLFYNRLLELGLKLKPQIENTREQGSDDGIWTKLLSCWHPQHRLTPLKPQRQHQWKLTNSVIEEEIVSCGKSAYVGQEQVVQAELKYLKVNYLRQPFQLGKVDYAGGFSGWGFEMPGLSKVPHAFNQFFESGIYFMLRKYSSYLEYLERRAATKEIREMKDSDIFVRALSLHGSIQTIFIIWLSMLVLSGIVSFGEIFYSKSILFQSLHQTV
jgi:hypothetical protein